MEFIVLDRHIFVVSKLWLNNRMVVLKTKARHKEICF